MHNAQCTMHNAQLMYFATQNDLNSGLWPHLNYQLSTIHYTLSTINSYCDKVAINRNLPLFILGGGAAGVLFEETAEV